MWAMIVSEMEQKGVNGSHRNSFDVREAQNSFHCTPDRVKPGLGNQLGQRRVAILKIGSSGSYVSRQPSGQAR
jgi:hypothetical protein